MKLTAILMVAFNLHILASGVAQKVTFSGRDVYLTQVFSVVEKQTGYYFIYRPVLVKNVPRLTIAASGMPLTDFLNEVLKGLPLGYSIKRKTIFVKRIALAESKESVNETIIKAPLELMPVTGKVTAEDGQPLQGVNVSLKNKKAGTITDINGAFSINATVGQILVFSSVGFETREVKITADMPAVNIVLSKAVSDLSDVVVVGYGKQKRKDITGSVSSVPKERMEMVPNLNIAQALQGSVPGITIQQSQGGAAPKQSIMIRGRNSILADNSPLIILDGVPYSGELLDINPNDVLSMEVLKDASAAAIYGSRGANGVIIVTTKIGSTGKPKISIDSRLSLQNVINLPVFLNGKEFYDFKELREPGKITATEREVYDKGEGVSWPDLALRQGRSQQHNLSVSGGSQNTNYFIGGSYLDVKGVAINDGYRRGTIRVNVETDIKKWLKIGTRNQFSHENRIGSPLDWVLVFRKNPLIKPFDAEGNVSLYPWPEFIDIRNPLEPVNHDYKNGSYQLITNNFIVVKFPFINGLTYQLNTGMRRKFGDGSNYIGSNTAAGLEAQGIAYLSKNREKNTTIENVLSYTKSLGRHNLFVTGAYAYEENQFETDSLEGRGFPNDFITHYSMEQARFIRPVFNYERTILNSQMLRINYSFDSRYLLTLTARRDGYSGFGANDKWGVFPSVALGWNLMDEKFFPWKEQVSKLKLRLSYGLNGNQAVRAYETISRYRQSNNLALGTTVPGYVPTKIGIDNLGWESSKTFNMGLDYGLFGQRIEGDINIFNTNTYDLLLNRTISRVNGLTSITQNIGKTRNTGIELSLTSRNITGNKFTWSTTGNLAYIKNKIVSLYGMLDSEGKEIDDPVNSWFIGKPIRSNYNYAFDGVWQQHEAAAATEWGSQPGFAKIKDVDGNKKIEPADRQILGQMDPSFTWGLSNTFSYKSFSVNVFMHGVHGVTMLNELLQDNSSGADVRRNVFKKNWWTPDNPTNEFYKNVLNAEKMGGLSAVIYENASFVRIKDISLSYDVSRKVLGSSGVDKLRLYVVARNLFTFTEWTGGDPELNNGRGITPLQKEVVFGLTLNL